MKRTSLFLPEDLMARLAAESTRTGTAVAELMRRAVDAATPPIGIAMGELRKVVDQTGFLRVFVLDARDGQLLVEPDDNKLQGQIQIWVDANLVRFGADSIVASHMPPEILKAMPSYPTESATTELLDIRANIKMPPEEEKS
jgi:hypothetical protein